MDNGKVRVISAIAVPNTCPHLCWEGSEVLPDGPIDCIKMIELEFAKLLGKG